MGFTNKLKDYAKKAVHAAKKNLDLSEVEYDHICYQTVSSDDYEKALKEIEGLIDIITQIPHAGRRITVARLKEPFEIDGININKLEISEPKPKLTVKKRGFDHMAFVVKGEFDHFLQKLKSEGVKITEKKQIGDNVIAKFLSQGVEIELRNKRMGENGISQKPSEKAQPEKPVQKMDTEDLQNQLNIEREKKLRALADYQNLKKRISEERDDFATTANAIILGQLLDILDDFDRALDNLKVDEKDQVGIRMVREKLEQLIYSNGLEEIKCEVGDAMDPNFFEAVGVVAVQKDEGGNIVKEIVQKGYKLKATDQVVRPVRVIVSKKS